VGQGSFGKVFKCVHKTYGGVFALKVCSNKEERRLAQLEVRAMREIESEHVVRLIEHFDFEGHMCIVMEYLEDDTLHAVLTK
jgi:serine/threonine protein kinase